MRRSAKKERRYQRRERSHDHHNREYIILDAGDQRSHVPGAQEGVPRRLYKHIPKKVHNYGVYQPPPGHRGTLVSDVNNSDLYYDHAPSESSECDMEYQMVMIEEPRRTMRPVLIQKKADKVHYDSNAHNRETYRPKNQTYPQTMRVHEHAASGSSTQSRRYLDSKGRLFILVDNRTKMYVGDLSPKRWPRTKKKQNPKRRNELLYRGNIMTDMIDEERMAEYPISSLRETEFIQEVSNAEVENRYRSSTRGSSGRRHRRMPTKSHNSKYSDDESARVVLQSEKKKERLKGLTRKKRSKKNVAEGDIAYGDTLRSEEFSVDDESIKLLQRTGRAVGRRTDDGRRRRRRTEDFAPRMQYHISGKTPKADKRQTKHRRIRTVSKLPKQARPTASKLSSILKLKLKESKSSEKLQNGRTKKPVKNRNPNKGKRRIDSGKERRIVSSKKPSKKKTTSKRDNEKKRSRTTKGGNMKKHSTPASTTYKSRSKCEGSYIPHGASRRKVHKGRHLNTPHTKWFDESRSSVYNVQDTNASQSKDFPFIQSNHRSSIDLTDSQSSRRNSSLEDDMQHDQDFDTDVIQRRADEWDEEKVSSPSNHDVDQWLVMHDHSESAEAGSVRRDLSCCESEVLSSLSSDHGYSDNAAEESTSEDEDSELDGGWLCSWEHWVKHQSMESLGEGNKDSSPMLQEDIHYNQNPNRASAVDESPMSHAQENYAARQYPEQDAPQVSKRDMLGTPWRKTWKQPDAVSKRFSSLSTRQDKHVPTKGKSYTGRQHENIMGKRVSLSARQQEKHFSSKRSSLKPWQQDKYKSSKRQSLATRLQDKHLLSKRTSLVARQQDKHMSDNHRYVVPRQEEVLSNWKILEHV